jgi:crotonobetainyl-CoA:carnitine CoA-transferase CaiB-like acyl-CoA transferase
MAGPLTGLTVTDFGQYVAGPLAAVMLADQGAEVVHVDPPGGPRWKTPADAFYNRGKRRIVVDLKSGAGQAAARELIGGSDVVIENFRPGVMERLGIGPAAMTAAHQRLIYCSIPGFGSGDPRAGIRAWEGVIDAATGNCRPRVGEEPPGWDWSRPTYSALPLASNFAGFLAATSVVMAAIARRRTGRGQRIEVPLFDAMFTLIGPAGAYAERRGLSPPAPIHGRGAGCFRCGDGRFVQFDTSSARHLTWFARAAGLTGQWEPELLDLERNADPAVNERLHGRLAELFLSRPAGEWEELGNRAGAAIGLVRTPGEWLHADHARAIGAVVELEDPELGPTLMPGLPVSLPESGAPGPAPRRLPEAGGAGSGRPAAAPNDATGGPEAVEPGLRHPLAGFRVLDLTLALAGPTCGRLLQEFGAEVTKISAPGSGAGGYLNRGKRSLLMDLRSPLAQGVFFRLAERSDVVAENFSPGTADRLGIGYDEVRARRPDVVYTSVSCYGLGGPWTPRRGWERQGQAVTGIMERTELPSVLGPYNLVDIGTGVLATFATGLALYQRLSTGRGQHVGASLVQTATYHQAPYLLESAQGRLPAEPRGYQALGEGPLQRFYQCRDGWLFLAATEGDLPALGRLLSLDGHPKGAGEGLEAALAARFAAEPVRDMASRLEQAGVAAHRVVEVAELMGDEGVRKAGLSVTQEVEGAGACTMPGLSFHLSGTPARLGDPPQRPGADAPAILAELGLGDRLAALERAWAVRVSDLPPAWGGGG